VQVGVPSTLEVDMVIGADGANSRVAKDIDAGEYDYAIAFQVCWRACWQHTLQKALCSAMGHRACTCLTGQVHWAEHADHSARWLLKKQNLLHAKGRELP
jgi:2-polyprenyl-6-methoxyphenol hydroxylase-like FAD-dependent oxidoreductase